MDARPLHRIDNGPMWGSVCCTAITQNKGSNPHGPKYDGNTPASLISSMNNTWPRNLALIARNDVVLRQLATCHLAIFAGYLCLLWSHSVTFALNLCQRQSLPMVAVHQGFPSGLLWSLPPSAPGPPLHQHFHFTSPPYCILHFGLLFRLASSVVSSL